MMLCSFGTISAFSIAASTSAHTIRNPTGRAAKVKRKTYQQIIREELDEFYARVQRMKSAGAIDISGFIREIETFEVQHLARMNPSQQAELLYYKAYALDIVAGDIGRDEKAAKAAIIAYSKVERLGIDPWRANAARRKQCLRSFNAACRLSAAQQCMSEPGGEIAALKLTELVLADSDSTRAMKAHALRIRSVALKRIGLTYEARREERKRHLRN